MPILRRLDDLSAITDGTTTLQLTAISDGSLSACARQSGLFGDSAQVQQYAYLDEIRQAWQLYTYSTNASNYATWQDAWAAFIAYAGTASTDFCASLVQQDGIELCGRMDASREGFGATDTPYTLYLTPYGRIRVYDTGVITLGTQFLGHCVTLGLYGEQGLANKARQAGSL